MDPHIIVARAYGPFIDLLRAPICKTAARCALTMLCRCCVCGGYRMAETADQGEHVHYPVDDLVAILALESQRHR